MDANEQLLNTFSTRVRQMILHYQRVCEENAALKADVAEREGRIAELNPLFQPFRIRHEQIVAHQLNLAAEPRGKLAPAVPILLAERVLNRVNIKSVGEVAPIINQLRAGLCDIRLRQRIPARLRDPFRARRINRNHKIISHTVAGVLDRRDNQLECLFIARQIRRKAALIADRRRRAGFRQNFLQRRIHLAAHHQPLAKGLRPDRHNHKFLNIYIIIGVRAAV